MACLLPRNPRHTARVGGSGRRCLSVATDGSAFADAGAVAEGVSACADNPVTEVLLADTVEAGFTAVSQRPVHLPHHGVSCAVVVRCPAEAVATLDVAVGVHHGGLHCGGGGFRGECQLGGGDAYC